VQSPEYAFNATALGLGGVLERGNVTTIIPSLGSVVLPSTGGEGSAEIRNYNCDEISFSTLQTRVGGYRVTETMYSAFSDILITNLTVLDRVRIALMQLTLTSSRNVNDDEARFEIRASYRGVTIDDEEVIPQLDVDMCAFETYAQFLQRAAEQPQFLLDKSDHDENQQPPLVPPTQPPLVVRSSIIGDICKAPNSTLCHHRNKVDVPGLGKLRFGEMLLKQGRRRVNLLRLDFGDPMLETPAVNGGTLVMASGEGNGMPVWPTN